jgi:radical SAM superfamily enzyme YgiQ (UPF0313 family)
MPLSIAYLAANLSKHGHDVDVIDALGEALDNIAPSYGTTTLYRGLSHQQILDRITTAPDGIGLTAMFSQEWPHIAELIELLHARYPGVPIIVGGEHATAASEYILRTSRGAQLIAIGEGEETILDFADHVAGTRTLDEISGVHYLAVDGRLKTTAKRPRITAPDDLPWPAWDLFRLDPYFGEGEGHGVERGRTMPILATRGCPYQCTFCSNPAMWTTRYVMRQVPLVVDEIEHYLTKYQAENIDFFDLTAIIKREWVLAFCAEIKRRGLKFTWQLPSGTRSEAMDEQVLREMAETGCMNVTYAPESGSEWTLDHIKKRVKLPKLIESIRYAKRYGVFVKCNLIIGFPKEQRRDIWKTLRLAVKFAWLGVDDTGLYPFSPYPGSELYNYLRSTGAVGEMNKDYFESLMSFMNLVPSVVFSEHVGRREITLYRIVGMSLFYGLSYLLHPSRIARSLRNYRENRSDTVFEERLFASMKRARIARQTQTAQARS